jgi:hypothetical protein
MATTYIQSVSSFADVTRVTVSEYEVQQKPTTNDIRETKALLRDFCITVTIPQFDSLSQLLAWRRNMVAAADYDTVELPPINTRKLRLDHFRRYYERYKANTITQRRLLQELGISSTTFYRYINELAYQH